jgi:hypothetical protein
MASLLMKLERTEIVDVVVAALVAINIVVGAHFRWSAPAL